MVTTMCMSVVVTVRGGDHYVGDDDDDDDDDFGEYTSNTHRNLAP